MGNFFQIYNQIRKQSYSHHHHHHHHHSLSNPQYQINEKDFKQAIMDIVWANAEKLVQFLYIVLDSLLFLLIRSPVLNGHLSKNLMNIIHLNLIYSIILVNVNQTCFETLTKIVQRIQRDLLSDCNDRHGRNRLLLTYIHYECTLHTSNEPGLF